MKKTIVLLFISLLLSCESKNGWHYAKVDQSPEWSKTAKECTRGEHQSPIDLSINQAKPLKNKFIIQYQDSLAEIENDGHTIKEKFDDTNFVIFNNNKYFLKQLHFHTHSEHSLNGIYFPAEIHLVHKSNDGNLLVLGIFIELNNSNNNRFGFFKNVHKRKTLVRLSKIKELNGAHYNYKGSLTTPPCTENVEWIIFDKHISLNHSQLRPFKKIFKHNYRPVNEFKQHELFHSDL